MSRSLKKGVFVNEKLLKKIEKVKALSEKDRDKTFIRTWSRSSTITPEMVGLNFEVHNGKTFIKVKVIEDMVGHKLGEFAPTRKFIRHGGKLQRELERSGVGAKT
jgi:small subunit ribosomal protein S19